jgi:hypothetical protein
MIEQIMSLREFKYGLLSLADKQDKSLVSESVIARCLAGKYIDADDATKADCTAILSQDLIAQEAGK